MVDISEFAERDMARFPKKQWPMLRCLAENQQPFRQMFQNDKWMQDVSIAELPKLLNKLASQATA